MKYFIQILMLAASLQSWAEFQGDHTIKLDAEASSGRYSSQINPFTTDGCSRFLDGIGKNHVPWLSCCEMHDIAYWAGLGGVDGHRQADDELYSCVKKKTNAALAFTIWSGVRMASPLNRSKLATEYRWGYGWPYVLGSDLLNDQQRDSVLELLPSILPSIDIRRKYYEFPPLTPDERAALQMRIERLESDLLLKSKK